MDKYEYNLKLEEIDKLVDQKDYEEAAKMADTIEWKRVRNVRTLCLISEIYEAAGRLEDSKKLLLWAYRRSPVGRTVLYRLVEITTALHQYDEAMEYYTEYVQAAPHDNNRYILKYQIYRGRGASVEELIAILEEYLGQEYTERWAYELAKLYQKAGQIQKCLATCDDLVLWFHSGKYVLKALELKKRYAPLTVKQQEILDQQLMDPEPEEPLDEEPDDVITKVTSTDGEMLAESIMAETEKVIADEVTAHKAEIDQKIAGQTDAGVTEGAVSDSAESAQASPEAFDDKTLQMELARSMREIIAGVVKRTEEEEDNTPVVAKRLQAIRPVEVPEQTEQPTAGRLSIDDVLLSMGERGREIAQSVREGSQEQIKDGTVADNDVMPGMPDEAPGISEAESAAENEAEKQSERMTENENSSTGTEEPRIHRTVAEAAEEELTDDQREALKYTNNPEKLLRNRSSLPTYQQDAAPDWENMSQILENADVAELEIPEIISESETESHTSELTGATFDQPESTSAMELSQEYEDFQKTRRIDTTRKEMEQEILSGKTIRVPSEKIAELHAKYGLKELWQEQNVLREMQDEMDRQSEAPQKQPGLESISGAYTEQPVTEAVSDSYTEQPGHEAVSGTYAEQPGQEAASGTYTEQLVQESVSGAYAEQPVQESVSGAYAEQPVQESMSGAYAEQPGQESVSDAYAEQPVQESMSGVYAEQPGQEAASDAYRDQNGTDMASSAPEAEGYYFDEDTDSFEGRSAYSDTDMQNLEDSQLPLRERPDIQVQAESRQLHPVQPQEPSPQPHPVQPKEPSRQPHPVQSQEPSRQPHSVQSQEPSPQPHPVQPKEPSPQPERKVHPHSDVRPVSDPQNQAQPASDPYRPMHEQNNPMLPEHIRGLFGGFTEIEGLEPQIANAVIQAVANKGDRTSRSGNILIFGPHGSGKTTMALSIAKAVAQDKGTGTLKLARIYATDLNRKDIAATIAKIAGGTLIIEEAGDLEPAIIEQLTTAMEFRTDGLLLILEDEEQYIHELLMNHPRFTMKFTSQIYIPVYTSDELLKFAQHAANEQGYIIGQEGQEELRQRVSGVVEQGNKVSVTDIVELVNRAIHKSNHLLRKMTMGKKRYDENDYIILFAKDFK